MSAFIDLTQPFYDGMPGFSMTGADGQRMHCTARVKEALSHSDTAPLYDGKCSFAYTELSFYGSIGTRLDSPYIRYPEGRDISALSLEELILPGHVLDLRGWNPEASVEPSDVELPDDLKGHALLFNFGWDADWGGDRYLANPYIGTDLVDLLIEKGVKLVGVDCVSVDGKVDPERPAHSRLLKNEVLIVEDLRGLEALHGKAFRFFALPLPVRGAASMPVRVLAEILS